MTDEYTQPDCPTPADATYQRDEAKRSSCSHSKGWPNELEAALLALAALFFGMWGYMQLLRPFGSQAVWVSRLREVIPIALLLVLVLWMQRRFRFELFSRFSTRAVVIVVAGVCAAQLIGQVVFYGAPTINTLLWSILWVGLTVPIVEELFFRGVLLKALLQHFDESWAVLIATLAFAFVHPSDQPLVFFGRLFLGALLGVLMVNTRSIIFIIFVHIAYNFVFILPLL